MARFSFGPAPPSRPAALVVTDPADAPAGPAPSAATRRRSTPPRQAQPERSTPDRADDAASVRDDGLLDMRLKLHARLIDEIDLSKLDKLDETRDAPPGAPAGRRLRPRPSGWP